MLFLNFLVVQISFLSFCLLVVLHYLTYLLVLVVGAFIVFLILIPPRTGKKLESLRVQVALLRGSTEDALEAMNAKRHLPESALHKIAAGFALARCGVDMNDCQRCFEASQNLPDATRYRAFKRCARQLEAFSFLCEARDNYVVAQAFVNAPEKKIKRPSRRSQLQETHLNWATVFLNRQPQ